MTYSPPTRRRRTRPAAGPQFDAVTFLTIYLVLLLAVPSGLRISALGSAGSPALLWALVGGLWWLAERLRARRPVLWGVGTMPALALLFTLAVAVSYVLSVLRTTPALEGNTADMGLIRVAAWLSVLIVTSDGIDTWERFLVLLRRLALAGGLMGLLGLLQFMTGQSLIGWISIPGMSADDEFGVITRGSFTRASGTTSHPLEFAVVVTMALPLAAALALHDRTRRAWARWAPLGGITAALAVSVSRSGVIGLGAALLVMALGWPRRTQLLTLVGVAGVGLAVYLLVPGMGTTVLELFRGIGEDDSTQSRTGAYGLATWVAGHSIWFGRGLGTFVPAYMIFDNQMLLLLIEVGVVGLGMFLIMVVGGVHCARSGRRYTTDAVGRDVGQALAAALVSATLLLLFFDGLSFPMVGGLIFVYLGAAGAYREMAPTHPRGPQQDGGTTDEAEPSQSPRR